MLGKQSGKEYKVKTVNTLIGLSDPLIINTINESEEQGKRTMLKVGGGILVPHLSLSEKAINPVTEKR